MPMKEWHIDAFKMKIEIYVASFVLPLAFTKATAVFCLGLENVWKNWFSYQPTQPLLACVAGGQQTVFKIGPNNIIIN